MKSIAFKDRVKIQAFAGDGGKGCVSFRREKFIPHGGPDGGNGGNGGNVFVRADKDVDSLSTLYFQPLQRARHGGKGTGNNRTGETGEDLVIPVPCGTVVYELPPKVVGGGYEWIDPDQPEESETPPAPPADERTYVGEVVQEGETLLVAKGGKGGRGNLSYATSTNRAPREFTPGTEGEHKHLLLELKLVAEVGLVGYPNAGKSTLLSKLSHAHPKIGAYPFTTLNPLIGILAFEDFTTIRIADIPGLIEGAHRGVGLGHDFLRHIERTKMLIYVIDMAGTDGRDPVHDYESLRRELELYNENLPHRPALVAANKMDVPEAAEQLARFTRETGITPFSISAEQGLGLDALKQAMHDWKNGLRFVDEAPEIRH